MATHTKLLIQLILLTVLLLLGHTSGADSSESANLRSSGVVLDSATSLSQQADEVGSDAVLAGPNKTTTATNATATATATVGKPDPWTAAVTGATKAKDALPVVGTPEGPMAGSPTEVPESNGRVSAKDRRDERREKREQALLERQASKTAEAFVQGMIPLESESEAVAYTLLAETNVNKKRRLLEERLTGQHSSCGVGTSMCPETGLGVSFNEVVSMSSLGLGSAATQHCGFDCMGLGPIGVGLSNLNVPGFSSYGNSYNLLVKTTAAPSLTDVCQDIISGTSVIQQLTFGLKSFQGFLSVTSKVGGSVIERLSSTVAGAAVGTGKHVASLVTRVVDTFGATVKTFGTHAKSLAVTQVQQINQQVHFVQQTVNKCMAFGSQLGHINSLFSGNTDTSLTLLIQQIQTGLVGLHRQPCQGENWLGLVFLLHSLRDSCAAMPTTLRLSQSQIVVVQTVVSRCNSILQTLATPVINTEIITSLAPHFTLLQQEVSQLNGWSTAALSAEQGVYLQAFGTPESNMTADLDPETAELLTGSEYLKIQIPSSASSAFKFSPQTFQGACGSAIQMPNVDIFPYFAAVGTETARAGTVMSPSSIVPFVSDHRGRDARLNFFTVAESQLSTVTRVLVHLKQVVYTSAQEVVMSQNQCRQSNTCGNRPAVDDMARAAVVKVTSIDAALETVESLRRDFLVIRDDCSICKGHNGALGLRGYGTDREGDSAAASDEEPSLIDLVVDAMAGSTGMDSIEGPLIWNGKPSNITQSNNTQSNITQSNITQFNNSDTNTLVLRSMGAGTGTDSIEGALIWTSVTVDSTDAVPPLKGLARTSPPLFVDDSILFQNGESLINKRSKPLFVDDSILFNNGESMIRHLEDKLINRRLQEVVTQEAGVAGQTYSKKAVGTSVSRVTNLNVPMMTTPVSLGQRDSAPYALSALAAKAAQRTTLDLLLALSEIQPIQRCGAAVSAIGTTGMVPHVQSQMLSGHLPSLLRAMEIEGSHMEQALRRLGQRVEADDEVLGQQRTAVMEQRISTTKSVTVCENRNLVVGLAVKEAMDLLNVLGKLKEMPLSHTTMMKQEIVDFMSVLQPPCAAQVSQFVGYEENPSEEIPPPPM